MKLEERLNGKKNEIGLVGAPLRFTQVSNSENNVVAFIDPQDWHIEIHIDEKFNPVPDRRTRQFVRKKNITNPLEKVCEDILYHECGHWELPRTSGFGCPYNTEYLDEIKDGVNKALKEKGKDPKIALSTGQTLEDYISNMVCDLINNTNCRQHTQHSGQILFWNDQGLTSDNRKFPKLYEAFVKLNMYSWADSIDERLLRRFYTNDKAVIEAVKKVVKEWSITRDHRSNIEKLFNKEDWNDISFKFTLAIADLIDASEKQLQLFGASENGVEKSFKFRDEKEKVIYGRYKKSKGPTSHLETFEQKDLLYRRLSKEIPVRVETIEESLSFPVASYGRQFFDEERHDLRRERIKGFSLDESGNLKPRIARGHILTESGYRRNIRSFPKLKVVLLDTSGSMKHAPDCNEMTEECSRAGSKTFIPWGDNSKYHYALKGWYGIQNFLEQQGFAPYVDNSLINFSNENIASGRKKPEDIDEVKRLALSPQFGSTTLDPAVLKKQLEEDAFVLSISDGDVQNWDSIRDDYRRVVQRASYAHIQLGSENQFTRDLKRWNIPVYFVRGNDDLSRLMVEVASTHYKNYAFSKVQETRSTR